MAHFVSYKSDNSNLYQELMWELGFYDVTLPGLEQTLGSSTKWLRNWKKCNFIFVKTFLLLLGNKQWCQIIDITLKIISTVFFCCFLIKIIYHAFTYLQGC